MRNLEVPLSALYTYIIHAEKANHVVSSVNVGWHIEHSLLVIIKIVETVSASDPRKYKWKFNILRAIVFFLNRFTRGKGVAPDTVIPKKMDRRDFEDLFAKARHAIEELKSVKRNQYFLHPIFGNLNKENTFIMLDIHTRHHIYIIKDIIASGN